MRLLDIRDKKTSLFLQIVKGVVPISLLVVGYYTIACHDEGRLKNALRHIKSGRAVERSNAIRVIAKLGTKKDHRHIFFRLDDSSPSVRRVAVEALRTLQLNADVGVLCSTAKSFSLHGKESVISVLAKTSNARAAIHCLMSYLDEDDPVLHLAAENVLESLNVTKIEQVKRLRQISLKAAFSDLNANNSIIRQRGLLSLLKYGRSEYKDRRGKKHSIIDKVLALLPHATSEEFAYIAELLARTREKRAYLLLNNYIKKEGANKRHAAIAVLHYLKAEERNRYDFLLNDKDASIQKRYIQQLSREDLNRSGIEEKLCDLISKKNSTKVRIAAAKCLALKTKSKCRLKLKSEFLALKSSSEDFARSSLILLNWHSDFNVLEMLSLIRFWIEGYLYKNEKWVPNSYFSSTRDSNKKGVPEQLIAKSSKKEKLREILTRYKDYPLVDDGKDPLAVNSIGENFISKLFDALPRKKEYIELVDEVFAINDRQLNRIALRWLINYQGAISKSLSEKIADILGRDEKKDDILVENANRCCHLLEPKQRVKMAKFFFENSDEKSKIRGVFCVADPIDSQLRSLLFSIIKKSPSAAYLYALRFDKSKEAVNLLHRELAKDSGVEIDKTRQITILKTLEYLKNPLSLSVIKRKYAVKDIDIRFAALNAYLAIRRDKRDPFIKACAEDFNWKIAKRCQRVVNVE